MAWAVTAGLLVLPGTAPFVAGAAAVLGALLLAVGLRCNRGRIAWALLALSCAILLVTSARVAVLQDARLSSPLGAAAAAHETVTLEVSLTGYPATSDSVSGKRDWVTARSVEASVPVVLWLEERAPPEWAPGTQLEIRGAPRSLDPGDAAAFGIAVREVSASTSGSGVGFGAFAVQLRGGLRAAAAADPRAELVPGLSVGDTSLVGEELDRAMRDSSLAHLTAVSGANCALVTGGIAALAARCGAGRRVRMVIAALGLGAFVTVVGPDPSVLRATVMAVVVLVSRFGGRPESGLPALGIAICVLLVADPWQALHAGFALSVAATAGIMLLAGPLTLAARALWLPRPLALAVAVAAAAQFACGPFLLLLQPDLPAVGVLANVLAAPAAPVGTALGLGAALLVPLSPSLGAAGVWLAAWPAQWIELIAEWSSALPLARWIWPAGWPGAVLLTIAQAAAVLAWLLWSGRLRVRGLRPRRPRQAWQSTPPAPKGLHALVAGLFALTFGIVAATSLVTPLAQRAGIPADWAVAMCDVGQGDAILLRDPNAPKQVMLVDTGDDPALLRTCLNRFSIDRIALLVLTHDDQDHVGALSAIAGRVDRALIAPAASDGDATQGERAIGAHDPASTARERPLTLQLEQAGVPFAIGAAGMVHELAAPAAGMAWRVLAPVAGTTATSTNAASLVLEVEINGMRVLLLGDTGLPEQQALMRANPELKIDVLKVSHHGSADRLPGLPARTGAQLGLVSVGADNNYGHPNSKLLTELAQAGIPLLRTDEYGSLAVVPGQGGELDVWVEHSEPRVGGRR